MLRILALTVAVAAVDGKQLLSVRRVAGKSDQDKWAVEDLFAPLNSVEAAYPAFSAQPTASTGIRSGCPYDQECDNTIDYEQAVPAAGATASAAAVAPMTAAAAAPAATAATVATAAAPSSLEDAIASANAAEAAATQMHDEAAQEAQARADALEDALARADAAAAEAKQMREQAIQGAEDRAEGAEVTAVNLRAQLAAAEEAETKAEEAKAAALGTLTAAEQKGGTTATIATTATTASTATVATAAAPTTVATVAAPSIEPVASAPEAATSPAVAASAIDSAVSQAVAAAGSIAVETATGLPAYNLTSESEMKAPQTALSTELGAALPAYDLSQDASAWANATNATVTTLAIQSTQEENCTDIHGKYADTQGEFVIIFQSGCFLTVKMSGGVKSGSIKGQDLMVPEFAQSGRVSDVGDVFFSDGTRWMKTTSEAPAEADSTAQPLLQPADESEQAAPAAQEANATANATNQTAPAEVNSIDGSLDGSDFRGVDDDSLQSAEVVTEGQALSSKKATTEWSGDFSRPSDEQAAPLPMDRLSDGVTDQCIDVSGHYKNPKGLLVSVKQHGCGLKVMMLWWTTNKEVIKDGTVDGNFVHVDDFDQMAAKIGQNIEFMQGPVWQKVSKAELKSIPKDHCYDASGNYSDHTGKLVEVEQVGCHANIMIRESSSQEHYSHVGVLNHALTRTGETNSLTITDFNKTGTALVEATGNVMFEDGLRWGKLSPEAAAAAYKAKCNDITGHYRDKNGNVASIDQDGCAVKVQMHWDEERGDVTVGGYVYGSMLHVKDFQTLGQAYGDIYSKTGIQFLNYDWTKLTDQQRIDLGVPEAGCANFAGEYKDGQGNPAIVNQTDCHLEVTFYLDTVGANVTKPGYVSQDTVHIQDFTQNGALDASTGDINFKSQTVWKFVHVNKTDSVDATNTSWEVSKEVEMDNCSSYGGNYKDKEGKAVVITQKHCDVEITFWLDSADTNITQQGHVNGSTLKAEGLADGVISETGIQFPSTQWITVVENITAPVDNLTAPVDDPATYVEDSEAGMPESAAEIRKALEGGEDLTGKEMIPTNLDSVMVSLDEIMDDALTTE